MNPTNHADDDRIAQMNNDDGMRDMRFTLEDHTPVYTLYDTANPDAWVKAEGAAYTHVEDHC